MLHVVAYLEVIDFIFLLTNQCGRLGLFPELVDVLWGYFSSLYEDSFYLSKKMDGPSPPMPQDRRCNLMPMARLQSDQSAVLDLVCSEIHLQSWCEQHLKISSGLRIHRRGALIDPQSLGRVAEWPALRLGAVDLAIWDSRQPSYCL